MYEILTVATRLKRNMLCVLKKAHARVGPSHSDKAGGMLRAHAPDRAYGSCSGSAREQMVQALCLITGPAKV